MKNFMSNLNAKCYTHPGFYVSAAAALLGLIAAIVYAVGFSKPAFIEYYSVLTWTLLLAGFVCYLGLEAFVPTAELAPKILWGFTFGAFLAFIGSSYMYLSGVFYSGVSMETIALIDGAFLWSAILIIVATVTANVSIWLKHADKEVNEDE